MAMSGLQVYKLLPKTNCKDCGFPTCLAFAMKLAAKQVELDACPHVSDEAKEAVARESERQKMRCIISLDYYECRRPDAPLIHATTLHGDDEMIRSVHRAEPQSGGTEDCN